MREILELLERQAWWQKSRKDLPWAEKIRMVQLVREDAARWSLSGRKGVAPPEKSADDQP